MKHDIRGVGVALVTPFDQHGEIDYQALGRVVDHVTTGGVDYLVVLGTTAETPTLTQNERSSVVTFIRERNAGRLPIIIGAGGYSTSEVIRNIEQTDLDGIAAILSVTPYYNKPSQEGLYRHYAAIAEKSPLPVLLYNVPSRTGVNMLPETTLRLARDFDNIIGIKEACGTIGQMSTLLCGRPEGFAVISGDDALALPLISIGGDGVISVAANAFPDHLTRMVKAAFEGRRGEASALYLRLCETMQALFEEGSPAGVKAALSIKGVAGNTLRLPLVGCSERLGARLAELIERYEL